MTSKDFIARHYGVHGGVRTLSSILIDTNGNAYSYGYHYPLLFKVDGVDFVNVSGYSNTTAKHINWARSVAPKAIPVKLPSRSYYGHYGEVSHTLNDMLILLMSEHDAVDEQIKAKKRTDTQVYRDLVAQRFLLTWHIGVVRAELAPVVV